VDGDVVVSADGPVGTIHASTVDDGLAAWADWYAAAVGVAPIRPAPTGWCWWYHYFTGVTAADIEENVAAIHERELPVDVIQVDDGWHSGIGDWLTLSGRFSSLEALTERIVGTGLRTGIWVAPFLVGARSRVFAEHPEWLIPGTRAGNNWDQDTYGLDATHPGARHSGADPLTAYRSGVELIRDTIGPDAYLLGCGAPILPSVRLFDAMRVCADVAPHWARWTAILRSPPSRARCSRPSAGHSGTGSSGSTTRTASWGGRRSSGARSGPTWSTGTAACGSPPTASPTWTTGASPPPAASSRRPHPPSLSVDRAEPTRRAAGVAWTDERSEEGRRHLRSRGAARAERAPALQ